MRYFFKPWNIRQTTYKKKPSRRSKQENQVNSPARLSFESLESRRLLAITVDNPVDELDLDFSPGDISLREAVLEAQPNEIINFSQSLNGDTIDLDPLLDEIVIDKNLTIDASMLSLGLTIRAASPDENNDFFGSRIFNIQAVDESEQTVSLTGLTLTNGRANKGTISNPANGIFGARGGAILAFNNDMEKVSTAELGPCMSITPSASPC